MMKLNWRHKAGLFLTLVAVGCGLFLECSAKQAVGIALLGIAFAWLIGTLTQRTLVVTYAILICAVGLYVAVDPVWSDWNSVRNSAAQYDSAIADLRAAIKPEWDKGSFQPIESNSDPYKAYGGSYINTPPPKTLPSDFFNTRIVTISASTWNWIHEGWNAPNSVPAPPKGFTLDTQRFPITMSDAEIMQAFEANLLLPRPTLSHGSSVRAHAWNVFGGLALFAFGLSISGWLFRRRQVETRSLCTVH